MVERLSTLDKNGISPSKGKKMSKSNFAIASHRQLEFWISAVKNSCLIDFDQ